MRSAARAAGSSHAREDATFGEARTVIGASRTHAGARPGRARAIAMPNGRPTVKVVRAAMDAALAAVLVALMATSLVEEAPHEYLGIAAFVLMTAHQVLNRAWWRTLGRGRLTARRVVSIALNCAVALCVLGLMASCLVLSEHAFWWLPALDGAWWARPMHLACSYWLFMLGALHLGMHLDVRRIVTRGSVAVRVGLALLAVIACVGVWSFTNLDVALYASMQSQFVFADATVPFASRYAQWATVGALFVSMGAILCAILPRGKRRAAPIERFGESA